MWRLFRERYASLPELTERWSLDEVMRANAILDAVADAEREVQERLKG